MTSETKSSRPARLRAEVGPGDPIWVASPEDQEGKAGHLVSWQGQVAEVRFDDDPDNVKTVPRGWVFRNRSREQSSAAKPAPDGRGAADGTVDGCREPLDALKKVIPLVIKRLEKEIEDVTSEVRRKESELREARRHRTRLMEQRRHEIGRLKVALKVLSRPRKKTQSGKRR